MNVRCKMVQLAGFISRRSGAVLFVEWDSEHVKKYSKASELYLNKVSFFLGSDLKSLRTELCHITLTKHTVSAVYSVILTCFVPRMSGIRVVHHFITYICYNRLNIPFHFIRATEYRLNSSSKMKDRS